MQCQILIKWATNVKDDIVYKIMRRVFFFFGFWFFFSLFVCLFVFRKIVSFLSYVAKYPDWLRHGYHGNQLKNLFSLFCVLLIALMYPTRPKIWCQSRVGYFSFELHLLPCLAIEGPCLVTMATKAKQQLFLTTRHHGLWYGIQHLSADIWGNV